jgi:hypothetical protein
MDKFGRLFERKTALVARKLPGRRYHAATTPVFLQARKSYELPPRITTISSISATSWRYDASPPTQIFIWHPRTSVKVGRGITGCPSGPFGSIHLCPLTMSISCRRCINRHRTTNRFSSFGSLTPEAESRSERQRLSITLTIWLMPLSRTGFKRTSM